MKELNFEITELLLSFTALLALLSTTAFAQEEEEEAVSLRVAYQIRQVKDQKEHPEKYPPHLYGNHYQPADPHHRYRRHHPFRP